MTMKVAIAKFETRLEEHIKQQDKDMLEIKTAINVGNKNSEDIKLMLQTGQGKIKRNHMLISNNKTEIKEHKTNHWKLMTLSVSVAGVVAVIISAVIAYSG